MSEKEQEDRGFIAHFDATLGFMKSFQGGILDRKKRNPSVLGYYTSMLLSNIDSVLRGRDDISINGREEKMKQRLSFLMSQSVDLGVLCYQKIMTYDGMSFKSKIDGFRRIAFASLLELFKQDQDTAKHIVYKEIASQQDSFLDVHVPNIEQTRKKRRKVLEDIVREVYLPLKKINPEIAQQIFEDNRDSIESVLSGISKKRQRRKPARKPAP